jgi:hypothetical protein
MESRVHRRPTRRDRPTTRTTPFGNSRSRRLTGDHGGQP